MPGSTLAYAIPARPVMDNIQISTYGEIFFPTELSIAAYFNRVTDLRRLIEPPDSPSQLDTSELLLALSVAMGKNHGAAISLAIVGLCRRELSSNDDNVLSVALHRAIVTGNKSVIWFFKLLGVSLNRTYGGRSLFHYVRSSRHQRDLARHILFAEAYQKLLSKMPEAFLPLNVPYPLNLLTEEHKDETETGAPQPRDQGQASIVSTVEYFPHLASWWSNVMAFFFSLVERTGRIDDIGKFLSTPFPHETALSLEEEVFLQNLRGMLDAGFKPVGSLAVLLAVNRLRIDFVEGDGWLLRMAAKNGHSEGVQALLAAGVEPDAQRARPLELLQWAGENIP